MDGCLVTAPQGDAVAMVNIARAVNTAHADARLIAAAPDLLTVLRHIADAIESRNYFAAENAIPAARAAIAKAEGR